MCLSLVFDILISLLLVFNIFIFISNYFYFRYCDGYQAWGGFSWTAFRDLREYSSLAVFSTLQICTEWWAFEITAIEAGWLGVDPLAAQSIISTTASFIYNLFIGVAIAASV